MTRPQTPSRRAVGEEPSPGRGQIPVQRIDSGKTHEICLVWVQNDSRLCSLPRHHEGTHLAFPTPWPVRDISSTNPPYDRGIAACMERHPAGKALS